MYKRGRIDATTYKRIRKEFDRRITASKRKYYLEYFESYRNDMKKTWAGIRELSGIGRSKGNLIETITVNGVDLRSSLDISNAFAEYFSGVADSLEQNLPPHDGTSPLINVQPMLNSFSLYDVSVDECISIISNLKNTSYGLDHPSTSMLKNIKDVIAEPISFLINKSFHQGIFPCKFKEATITPIFKSGDTRKLCNYRPISVLPLISKIFERAMSDRLYNFFYRYTVLVPNQFGFQKNRSTCDAVECLIESIYTSLNDKMHNICLFIDLRKAYDTVQHNILLSKLSMYGIRGLPLEWMKSYLSGRIQRVKIQDCVSRNHSIRTGIPQGSVLGGLLFLIYVNDLPRVSRVLSSVLFADDTCFSLSDSNYSRLVDRFNVELIKVYDWLGNNRLSLNFDKTVAMHFTNRHDNNNSVRNLLINNNVISFSNEVKYLGIIIDHKLTFANHISYLCGKIAKSVGILYRLSNHASSEILHKTYFSFIYPYLNYCNIVWGGAAMFHINKLSLLQKKAVRVICKSDYLAHTEELFKKTEILPVNLLYRYFVSIHSFKNRNNYRTAPHHHNTRHAHNFVPSFERLSVTQRSLSYLGPKTLNELPPQILNCPTLTSFKTRMKKHLLAD